MEARNASGDIVATPETLIEVGPSIPVVITVAEEVQQAYSDRGETPPEPVNGFALIDTGASVTCFDVDAAQKARLPQISVSKMTSATHSNQTVPTFAGTVVCPTFNINVEEGMGANLSAQGNNLVALIGRDLLQSAVLIYNGPDGHFSLSL
ncbi:MAG: hypothetical protein OXE94_00120 [Aestuariivita sp.]|nr:hypothetical protein [Aestuariivita sp.]MCY4202126.1 hypothetical protein [Aestuariivita sp.]MCY4288039.1 hypothetical protein [Aestuariivita sp.]MCY4345807.1 hypothetical protein [Aestuariivita sp.]